MEEKIKKDSIIENLLFILREIKYIVNENILEKNIKWIENLEILKKELESKSKLEYKDKKNIYEKLYPIINEAKKISEMVIFKSENDHNRELFFEKIFNFLDKNEKILKDSNVEKPTLEMIAVEKIAVENIKLMFQGMASVSSSTIVIVLDVAEDLDKQIESSDSYETIKEKRYKNRLWLDFRLKQSAIQKSIQQAILKSRSVESIFSNEENSNNNELLSDEEKRSLNSHFIEIIDVLKNSNDRKPNPAKIEEVSKKNQEKFKKMSKSQLLGAIDHLKSLLEKLKIDENVDQNVHQNVKADQESTSIFVKFLKRLWDWIACCFRLKSKGNDISKSISEDQKHENRSLDDDSSSASFVESVTEPKNDFFVTQNQNGYLSQGSVSNEKGTYEQDARTFTTK